MLEYSQFLHHIELPEDVGIAWSFMNLGGEHEK